MVRENGRNFRDLVRIKDCRLNEHKRLKTKSEALNEYLNDKTFDDIVIIGDSIGDIALKNVAGGTTYYYIHPNRKAGNVEADYVINDLREILREI